MSDKTNKPVIFLAFANDRDDTVGYLRNLPDEARRLLDVLQPAGQAGLCEVVVRSNSTAGDIFKVFQDPKFRNRIAIFHYGGHANGYQLLLESAEGQSATADAGGLAAFFAQQQGLQLVFLNGCSTQQQTRGLLDANIPAVISTSQEIDDQVATDFAYQFYQGLAGGTTIRTAYNEAQAAVRTAKGDKTRALHFGRADKPEGGFEADEPPWELDLREDSESADQWNLPEAVNDPLFGLPPLPKLNLPENPYRHLAWFTRDHADVFFGRGHQIRQLYHALTTPDTQPVILLYGQSGVGKSSLLDAGLIPRLEGTHDVCYLRRQESGLLPTLESALRSDSSDVPLACRWLAKEQHTRRPLTVILDQVEEAFTRPLAESRGELRQLVEFVKATFGDPERLPAGRLILGFRKEWLAEIENAMGEQEIPRAAIFLEPLDPRGIIEAVRGPTLSPRLRSRYRLEVEDGLAELIAGDLLEDSGSAIAPTLQILLTKMWAKAKDENYEHPTFSQELYQQLKRDGILLRDFLIQQIAALRECHREAVDSGLLLDILALHTTVLGTADQCTVEQLQQQYAHLDATLPDLLQRCQDLHLLTVAVGTQKKGGNTTRLAHDTLAPLVRERFDESDKPGQRARRILDNRAVDWEADREGTPLDEADLAAVERGVSGTRALSPTEQKLLKASREVRDRLRRNRRIRAFLAVGAVIAIVALGAYGWWAKEGLNARNVDLEKQTKVANYERIQAEVSGLRARSEESFARAHRNEALAARVKMQGSDIGSDPEYLARINKDAQVFRERGRDYWKTAFAKQQELRDHPAARHPTDTTRGHTSTVPNNVFSLEALEARNGADAMIIHYGPSSAPKFIVVDGGMRPTFDDRIKPRLSSLKEIWGRNRALPIELVIATQYNMSSLRGIWELTRFLGEEEASGSPMSFHVKALWYNNFLPIDTAELDLRSRYLRPKEELVLLARQLRIPLNYPFDYFVMPAPEGSAQVRFDDDLTITVIGPFRDRVEAFYKLWQREQSRTELQPIVKSLVDQMSGSLSEGFSSSRITLLRAPPREEARALWTTFERERDLGSYSDMSSTNLSSIVSIFEVGGKTMLLASDARGDDIIEGLFRAGVMSPDGRYHVDLLKIPHSGSDRNVTTSFFRQVTADHYVILGDGTYGNPETATLQMIADARGEEEYTIHFSHRSGRDDLAERLDEFLSQQVDAGSGLRAVFREDEAPSMTVDLLTPIEY